MDVNDTVGPNGFRTGFYQSCWNIIKEDLIEAVKDFSNLEALPT